MSWIVCAEGLSEACTGSYETETSDQLAGNYRGRGLDVAGPVEEGNLGLIRAVDRYDPKIVSLCHLCSQVDSTGG